MKNIVKILVVIVATLFTKQLSAQLYTNYVKARHPFKLLGGTYKKAYDLSHQGKNDEFLILMNQLVDSVEQVNDWDRYLLAQNELATFYVQQSNPSKSLEIIQKTEKKCKAFIDTLSTEYIFMYKVYWFSYSHLNDLKNVKRIADLRYKASEKRIKERELNNKELALDLDAYDEISITYAQISNFEKQFKCIEKSFELAEYLNWNSKINKLYGRLGSNLLGKGYENYAYDFLSKDYHSNKLRNYYDSVMIIGSLDALSDILLTQNNFRSSLELLNKWDGILENHPHPFPHQKALCQLKKGHVYGKMGNTDSAEYYYKLALKEIAKTNKKSIEIETYINLAKIYAEVKNDRTTAYLYLSKIDSIFAKNESIDREIIDGYFLFLYEFHRSNNQLEQAIHSLQRGINYLADTVTSDIYEIPEIPINKIKRETLKLYEAKINGLIEYFENNEAVNKIQIINNHFNLFNKYYLIFLKENTNKKLIQKTLSDYRKTIDNVVDFYCQFESLNEKEKENLFVAISQGKGVELFIEKQKIEYNKLANNTNHQAYNVEINKNKILQIENQLKLLNEEDRKELIEKLNDSVISLKRKTILAEIQLRFKTLEEINSEEISNVYPAEIQKSIPQNSTLIEYHITSQHLIAIIFTKSSFSIKIDHIEDLNKTLKACYRKIKTGDNIEDESQQLYNKLIKPIEKEIAQKSNLIFILDRNLHNIPFEILSSQENGLIENYTISYAYSSGLWNKSTKDKKLSEYKLLAVAPIFKIDEDTSLPNADFRSRFENDSLIFRSSKGFQPLLYTESEVNEIVNLFKQNRKPRKIITGGNATKEKFISELNQANIIHIATHGLVNKENPYLSGIALFPKGEKYSNNDVFYHYELYDKKLNADLVVLSACQTGTGKLIEGEGVMALPRGFIYAGVPNVIASLWKVHDEKTKDLMVAFYKHLLEDKVSYAEALRLAKLDCIEKGFLPLDWAGFVLIGN